jgi:hypothetical protein
MSEKRQDSRREFIKKTAYIAPAILSLQAMPAIAEIGSPPDNDGPKGNNGLGQRTDDPQPPGNPPVNDKPSSEPGNPNNQGGNN